MNDDWGPDIPEDEPPPPRGLPAAPLVAALIDRIVLLARQESKHVRATSKAVRQAKEAEARADREEARAERYRNAFHAKQSDLLDAQNEIVSLRGQLRQAIDDYQDLKRVTAMDGTILLTNPKMR